MGFLDRIRIPANINSKFDTYPFVRAAMSNGAGTGGPQQDTHTRMHLHLNDPSFSIQTCDYNREIVIFQMFNS